MLSRWLRWALAAVAVLATSVALLGANRGVGAADIAALATAGLSLIITLIVAVSYGFALIYAYSPPRALQVTGWRILKAAMLEWLATFALFVIIQPFARWWMGSQAVVGQQAIQPPLLLIHGYFCNRGAWWWLRRSLRAQGRSIATIDLEPPLADIDKLAEKLDARIRALVAETGTQSFVLVGHSMGGLTARTYLRRHGSAHVAKLITLGTPHHGTELARIGLGRNAREMEPGSAWIREHAVAGPLPVPTLSVWSARDNYVMPQDSSRLGGAREIILPTLGHLSMLFSPKILRILLDETAEPPRGL